MSDAPAQRGTRAAGAGAPAPARTADAGVSFDLRKSGGTVMEQRAPLVLVSNRSQVTFHAGGKVQRGSGGLVTALTGLASHRDAIWIASAMSEHDAETSRAHGGRAFPVVSPAGGEFKVRLVVSDEEAYNHYNVFANPMLWFIQHYLWDLSNAPDIRREEIEASSSATTPSTRTSRGRSWRSSRAWPSRW